MRSRDPIRSCALWCYAMPGTYVGYCAMLCPVGSVLCDGRYWYRVVCYALSGTDRGYAATRSR
eukprot:469541-Rhodomonas_salina.2